MVENSLLEEFKTFINAFIKVDQNPNNNPNKPRDKGLDGLEAITNRILEEAGQPKIEPNLKPSWSMEHPKDEEPWWYNTDPPFNDFNKEINHPGENPQFPEGCAGIRMDDDFWEAGIFPYRFKDLTIQDMVAVLWPEIQDPKFGPDASYFPPFVSKV